MITIKLNKILYNATTNLTLILRHGHIKTHASKNGSVSRHLLAWVRTRKVAG